MPRTILLTLPLALLAACSTSPAPAGDSPAAAVTPADLSAHHWHLDSARDAAGAPIAALLARADKPLTLDFADGRVAVGNACNGIGGGYTLAPGRLQVGPLMSTRMACSDPRVAALDAEIGNRLEGTLQLALPAPQRLRLTTAAGDVLEFAGEPTAATRYGGPGERVFLEVAAHTRPCPHPLVADMQCLQVRELHYDDKGLKTGTEGAFRHFYETIEGYRHQPGIRNVLRVNRYTVANPPADGSSKAYVLDLTVESERADP